jgi:ketol-acid reductoisomerase
MWDILAEIRSGAFAREWLLENQVRRPQYTSLVRSEKTLELERVGSDVRRITSQKKE